MKTLITLILIGTSTIILCPKPVVAKKLTNQQKFDEILKMKQYSRAVIDYRLDKLEEKHNINYRANLLSYEEYKKHISI